MKKCDTDDRGCDKDYGKALKRIEQVLCEINQKLDYIIMRETEDFFSQRWQDERL